jgi:hypothetical protein
MASRGALLPAVVLAEKDEQVSFPVITTALNDIE